MICTDVGRLLMIPYMVIYIHCANNEVKVVNIATFRLLSNKVKLST